MASPLCCRLTLRKGRRGTRRLIDFSDTKKKKEKQESENIIIQITRHFNLSGVTMTVSRSVLLFILLTLQAISAAKQHAITADSGSDVNLECFLEIPGEVVSQFWSYAKSENPWSQCKNLSFEVLTNVWPAYGLIDFGDHVTPQLKSRLILKADFDLILLNVSQSDAGCYQCGRMTVDTQELRDNVTVLTVNNIRNSGSAEKINSEDPASTPNRTALYICLGILFFISSVVVVVIIIKKKGKFGAVKRKRRSNLGEDHEDEEASASCLREEKMGKMDVLQATMTVQPEEPYCGSHMTVEVTVPGRQSSVGYHVDLWVEKTGGQVIYRVSRAQLVSGKYVTEIPVHVVGELQVKADVYGKKNKHFHERVLVRFKGQLIAHFNPPINNPHDIIKHGNAFVVTDKDNHQVKMLSEDFTVLGQFSPYKSFEPYGIACTGSTFVVTDISEGCIVEFDNNVMFSKNRHSTTFGQENLKQPLGIAVHRNGNIYVSDGFQHCVFSFDSNRRFLTKIGCMGSDLGQMNAPLFLAFNSKQNLAVAEFQNKRIQIWDTRKRTALRTIDIEYSDKTWHCRGLAIDDNDNIYVTARSEIFPRVSKEIILVYTASGKFLGNFGKDSHYMRGLTVTMDGANIKVYAVDGEKNCITAYKI